MGTRRFSLAVLLTGLAFVAKGCGADSTGPSAVAPTVTGSWDVTLTGTANSLAGIMTLTELNGTVTGSLQVANVTETLSGTVSQAGEMVLGYRDPTDGEQGLIRVTVDASRRSFTGTLTATSARGDVGTATFRGTKR